MDSPTYILNRGTKVRTHAVLESTGGFLIKQQHLDCRVPNTEGEILGYVPGHGGDVYWVQHANGDVAAYGYPEFELVP